MIFPEELYIPQKTIYKRGGIAQLSREVAHYGATGLIVHGVSLETNGYCQRIAKQFISGSVAFYCRTSGAGEPALDEITQVIECAKKVNAEWIVGIGGGSVLDLAKATAGLYNAVHAPVYYQEGGVLEQQGIPFIAVPTTAGTGAEATSNAVIINPEKKEKLSIRDKRWLACSVILDAELMNGIPHDVLLYSVMDAYVQSYEAYTSRNATWITDMFALKALALIDCHIEKALQAYDTDDLQVLLCASYCAGIALHSARLGVIHGIAHPLGVLYHEPHGKICAACFVPSIRLNLDSIGNKYAQLSEAVHKDFCERIQELLEKYALSSPFKGVAILEREKIIEATLSSGSTAANPKKIERKDVEIFLQDLF